MFPWEYTKSHGNKKNPMGYLKIIIVPWEFEKPHRKLSYSHGILKYPMGKQIIPWENLIFHGNLHIFINYITCQV